MKTQQDLSKLKIKITPACRAVTVALTAVSAIVVLASFAALASFFMDAPLHALAPNMHTNGTRPFFLGAQYEGSFAATAAHNVLVLALFWVQHLVMAKLSVKRFIVRAYPQYMAFERAVYNTLSGVALLVVTYAYAPFRAHALFTLPQSLIVAQLALAGVGVSLFFASVIEMNEFADLFGLNHARRLFSVSEMDFKSKYQPDDTGQQIAITRLYSICRHPMQLGVILMMASSGLAVTPDRIFVLGVMILGINIGVRMEEARLLTQFKAYGEYVKTVQNRFVPDFAALSGKRKTK